MPDSTLVGQDPTNKNDEHSWHDQPIEIPEEDVLNRAPFAGQVYELIQAIPSGEHLVVGIHGPWGDGKTSVLNLLRARLGDEDSVVVQDFNPWRYTGEDELFRGFFSMIANAIRVSLETPSERVKNRWLKVVTWIRTVTKRAKHFFKAAEGVDTLLAALGGVVEGGKSLELETLRERLCKHLMESPKKLVILVDDVDRLDKDETYALFRIIKACANFPNVCYVLAFDDVAVSKSIGERYGDGGEIGGRAFLEKIIQVPLNLPPANKTDLLRFCLKGVYRGVKAADVTLSREEEGEFLLAFQSGVGIRLSTPRSAKRFGNGALFALSSLRNEVNHVDLLLIEAVRAFYPGVYEVVRGNLDRFQGVQPERAGQPERRYHMELLAPALEVLSENEKKAVLGLLTKLFPRIDEMAYSTGFLNGWSIAKRICAPNYSERYFAYTISYRDVRDEDVSDFIELVKRDSEEDLLSWLQEQFDSPRAGSVIEKLRDHESILEGKAAISLAYCVAEAAKCLAKERGGFFSFAEPRSQAAVLISALLQSIDGGVERVYTAKGVLGAAEPIGFSVLCLRWMKPSGSKHEGALNDKEVSEVRKTLVERIKRISREEAPLFEDNEHEGVSLLREWVLDEGMNPVQEYLHSRFKKDSTEVSGFLRALAPATFINDEIHPRVGDFDDSVMKQADKFLPRDELVAYVKASCPGNLEKPRFYCDEKRTDDERLAEQFMYVHLGMGNAKKSDKD